LSGQHLPPCLGDPHARELIEQRYFIMPSGCCGCKYVAERQLVWVLADWCPTFSGYHLYCPKVVGNTHKPSACWSMHCAIATEAQSVPLRPLLADFVAKVVDGPEEQ
jgi:hypothetical protein